MICGGYMKNKKIIYIICGVLFVIGVICGIVFGKKDNVKNDNKVDNKSNTLVSEITSKNKKAYKKITNGEVLNENTNFREYAFISNNSIYIYNSVSLDSGIFEYKKVYDVSPDIKVMNVTPGYGSDIKYIDYNDTMYTLSDTNIDNKVRDSYDMYTNAVYELSNSLKWEYSTTYLGKKIDYDFMSNYAYSKDNILYAISYTNDKYPNIYKMDGNYEGEKVLRIYNERIVKTDKAFYEIVRYYDNKLNKEVTTTMKIKLLSKYYDEVLTFTYKYVILKDYTIIPINDVMENRVRDYQYNSFLSGFNSQEEIPSVFEE